MKEYPRVTYKTSDYTKEDLDEILEKLLKYETDYSKKLVEIRKEQILKHSKSYFISDTLNDLANLIGEKQDARAELLMKQYQEMLIELHSPVIFNIPLNLEPFHKWETWTFDELYDQYMCLAMSKGWEDYYSLVNDFSKNKRIGKYGLDFDIDYNLIKNYHVVDMLTDLILNEYKICGYELRSFMDITENDKLLQTFNKDSLIEVKLFDKLTMEEYEEMLGIKKKRPCGDVREIKYCGRDCIYFNSNYHMEGNEEWEDVSCSLGHNRVHDMLAECEDYVSNGG